jgi:chloramphenicol O-acetyltransferase type B
MSLWGDLKNAAWFVADRRWLPGVRVAYGARLGRDCELGESIDIGPGARVYGCQLGDQIRVGEASRLTGCRIESDCSVGPGCELGSVTLGRYSYFAGSARAGHIQFGRFCSIGPDFMCGWGDHPTNLLSGSPVFYSAQKQCGVSFAEKDVFTEWKPIVVGNDVWIGARVFVRDGVTIGDGAIIGAGAVVVADVLPYAVVGGVPAKILRMRFPEDVIHSLRELSWWNWDEARLRAAQPLFAQSDPHALITWAKAH